VKSIKELNPKPVVRRVCVLCKMQMLSPALIGSPDSFESDRDISINANGYPFIPGSTLAGILRATLAAGEADLLFGESDNGKTGQSPIWIYDAIIKDAVIEDATIKAAISEDTIIKSEARQTAKPARVITIDGVSLDENRRNSKEQKNSELDHMNKVAKNGAKFDYQAVDTDSLFELRMMLVIREGEYNLESLLEKVFLQMNNLYVGGKTSRGFGKLACIETYSRAFDFGRSDKEAQLDQWLGFKDWNTLVSDVYKRSVPYENKNSHLTAEITIDGSLIVRDIYSVEDDEDYAHTFNAEKSVIYGTSWAGAIRGGLAKLLKSNGFDKKEKYLDSVFGRQYWNGRKYVTEPSKIRIDASYIDGGKRIKYTRNKIDRFTGGSANTALFTNRPQFGGKCILSVYFDNSDEAIKELLLLAIDAISKGLITLGGETAVGRGVLSVGGVFIDGKEIESGGDKPALKEVIFNG